MSRQVEGIQVETASFPPSVKPPGSSRTLFLGGAGVRGIQVPGNFMKVTAIGLYLEDGAVSFLASKWKGRTAAELTESAEFIHDVIAGKVVFLAKRSPITIVDENKVLAGTAFVEAPFERFVRVTMLSPLTGIQYSEQVVENCIRYLKYLEAYTDAEAVAVEKFLQDFRDECFNPGASILFAQSPNGSTKVAFTKDTTIPETGKAVIENKKLSDAFLETIIGLNGVSPKARQSLATRLSELMSCL